MADEARIDLHHGASRCLLGLIDAAAGGLADWSEFDAEAERWGIEVRGLYPRDPYAKGDLFARTGKREKWGLSGVPRDESVAAG